MAEAISEHERATGRLDPPEAEVSGGDAHEPERGSTRRPLGSLLTGGGFITEAQLAEGLAEAARTGGRLGEVVVTRGWVTEDDIAKLLAEQWQLGYVNRASIFFDVEALARLSRDQAQSLEALPTRVQDGRMVVAVAEPTEQRLAALRAVIGDDTVVVVIPKTALAAGLRSDLLSGSKSRDDNVRSTVDEQPAPRADDVVMMSPPAATVVASEPTAGAAAGATRIDVAPPRAASADELDLRDTLGALEAAAGEATALQLRVSELARRLAGIVNDVASAVARLEQSGAAARAAPRVSTRSSRSKPSNGS